MIWDSSCFHIRCHSLHHPSTSGCCLRSEQRWKRRWLSSTALVVVSWKPVRRRRCLSPFELRYPFRRRKWKRLRYHHLRQWDSSSLALLPRLYVCVNVSLYACIIVYLFMDECIIYVVCAYIICYIYVCVCMNMCRYNCIYYLCLYVCVYIYLCMCVNVWMYVCVSR